MIYKLSNPYHTQRNNAVDPADTCQVTAAVMALRATGIPFSYPSGKQPEDYLAELLDSPESHEKLEKEFPIMAGRPPREVHAILSWAINEKLVLRKVTVFTTQATIQELLYRIARHKAASLVSGRFTRSGHVVTLVGFETDQSEIERLSAPDAVDLNSVRRIIVDDPWGNSKTEYGNVDGNDISYTLREFNDITRQYGMDRKWAHLFDVNGIF